MYLSDGPPSYYYFNWQQFSGDEQPYNFCPDSDVTYNGYTYMLQGTIPASWASFTKLTTL